MNSEIEQRIVAMYFDNKDFEKNAKQTIDTLGELKDSLNLENAVKGFDELDKAGKKLNLNQARTTIRNMKDSLSGMEGALKKAFDIGTAPLHALDNFFGTFRSYVGKFMGFDLASKFVGSLESAIRQLTVAPVQAGWNMYQQNIDSTKTIMSGTLKSYKEQMAKTSTDWEYSEDEHMEYVKKNLRELSDYAQQTVYSLSDMTSNVGKFTNNNVGLEDSVLAMEGIANMTAKAGQGAQQASMAMYNFSQAMGVGKLTTIDWKSIENANIATPELKQLFIDTAEAAGKLEAQVTKLADGTELKKFYLTVDKNGKKLAKNKWVEISAENFRETLQQGWLDKDTMLKVFKMYSGKVTDPDTLAAWGFDIYNENHEINQELYDYLKGIGEQASEAATQVRTFKKMWDAMTESVQSGWADSMQFIFGDMREATDFWTGINDKVGAILDASAKNRNDMLREWRGYSQNDAGEWVKVEGAVDGREALIEGIHSTIDALTDIGAAFKKAWADVFGGMTGKRLQEITAGFRDLINRFREWLGTTEDQESRLSKLSRGLRGFFNIIKIVVNVIKTGFNAVKTLVAPVADIFINLFDTVGGFFDGFADLDPAAAIAKLQTGVAQAWDSIKKYFSPTEMIDEEGQVSYGKSPFQTAVDTFFGNLAKTIQGWMGELGLENLWEGIQTSWEWIKNAWNKVVTWEGWTAIATFFVDAWTAIKKFFAPNVTRDENGQITSTEDSPFIKGLNVIWDGVKKTWDNIVGWKGWQAIAAFGTNIWAAVTGFFAPKVVKDSKGKVTGTSDSTFMTWVKNAWSKIKGVWDTVANWEGWGAIGGFFTDIWGWVADKATLVGKFFTQPDEKGKTGFITFIENFAAEVSRIWGSITNWEGWAAIGGFFTNIWGWIAEKAKVVGSWFTEPNDEGNTGFIQFIKDFAAEVSRIWGVITNWEGWAVIGRFFGNIWGWISEKANVVISWFSMPDENGKTGFVLFLERFAASVSHIWGVITGWDGWKEIGTFFGDIWKKVMSFFGGANEVTEDTAAIAETAQETGTTAKVSEDSVSLLQQIIDAVTGFISTVVDKVTGIEIPESVSKFFDRMGTFFEGIMNFIGFLAENIGKVLSGKADATSIIVTGVITIIAVIAQWFERGRLQLLSNINVESFASKLMHFGIGILAVSSAIALLTTLDQTKMMQAIGAVSMIGVVLGTVIGLLTKLNDSAAGRAQALATPTTSMERIATSVIKAVEKIGTIAVAMALLPGIIRTFGEVKKEVPNLEGSDIFETLSGLAILVSSISISLAAVSKITGNAGIDPVGAIKTTLSVVGAIAIILTGFTTIIGLIGGITNLLGGGDADAVIKVINDGAAVIAAVGGAIGGFFTSLFGGGTPEQKAETARRQMEELGEAAKVFDTEQISGISRMMSLVQSLSKQGESIDPKKLDGFSEAMGKLGAGIYEYVRFLKGEDYMQALSDLSDPTSAIYQRLMAFQDMGIKLSELFAGWGNTGWHMDTVFARLKDLADENSSESIQQLVEYLNKIMTGLGDLNQPETGIQFDGIAIVTKLYNAIQEGLMDPKLPKFDATPIVDSIVSAINIGEDTIALAVHNMVQAGMNASDKAGDGNGYTFDPEGLTGLTNGSGVNDMSDTVSKYQEMFYGKGGTADKPAEDSLMGMFSGLSSQMDGIEFPDMSEKLSSAFSFKDAETGENMDLTAELREMLGSFQEELDKAPSFEIKIIPTFDLSNLNEERLRTMLGDYPLGMQLSGASFNIPDMIPVDFSGLSAELNMEGIRGQIAGVASAVDLSRQQMVEAVNRMGDKITNLNSAILRLKLYLDTGALVGGITPLMDRELGRRADYAAETGVASMFGNPYAYLGKK